MFCLKVPCKLFFESEIFAARYVFACSIQRCGNNNHNRSRLLRLKWNKLQISENIICLLFRTNCFMLKIEIIFQLTHFIRESLNCDLNLFFVYSSRTRYPLNRVIFLLVFCWILTAFIDTFCQSEKCFTTMLCKPKFQDLICCPRCKIQNIFLKLKISNRLKGKETLYNESNGAYSMQNKYLGLRENQTKKF